MDFFGSAGASGGLLFDQYLSNSVFDPLSSSMNDIMTMDDNNFAFLDSFTQGGASASAPSACNGWPDISGGHPPNSNNGMLGDCMWGSVDASGIVSSGSSQPQQQPLPIGANRPTGVVQAENAAVIPTPSLDFEQLDNILSEFPDFDNMLFDPVIDEKPEIMPQNGCVQVDGNVKQSASSRVTPTSSVVRNNPLPVLAGSTSPVAGSSTASSSSRKTIMKPNVTGGVKSRKLLMTPLRPLKPLPIKPRLDVSLNAKSSGSPSTPLLSSPSPSTGSASSSPSSAHSSACSSPTGSPVATLRGRERPFGIQYKGLPSKKQLARGDGSSPRNKTISGSDNDAASSFAELAVSVSESDDIIRRLKGETNGTGHVPRAGDELILGVEERRLLAKEGKILPTHYPLTREQERILKMIRRKIRNKLSAMESRRKKKVYVDCLEDELKRKVEENVKLRSRVGHLEKSNEALQNQLSKLQTMAGSAIKNVVALRDAKFIQANCSTSSSVTSEAAAAAINNIIRRSPRDSSKVKSTYLLALVLSVMLVLPTTFKTSGPTADESKILSPTLMDAEHHNGPSTPFLQKLVGRMLNKRADNFVSAGKPVGLQISPEAVELSKSLGTDSLAHLGLFINDGSPSTVSMDNQKNASRNHVARNFEATDDAESDSYMAGWRTGAIRNGIWAEGSNEVSLPAVAEETLIVQQNGSADRAVGGGGGRRMKVTVIRAKNASSHDQIIASE